MKTLEFTRDLTTIVRDLKVGELMAILAQWIGTPQAIALAEANKSQFTAMVLDSHAGYDRLSALPDTAKILAGLGVNGLYEPGRMLRMLSSVSGANTSHQLRNEDFLAFFQTLRALQSLQMTSVQLLEGDKVKPSDPAYGLVEIGVMDWDGMGVEPARLQKIISTLVKLHANLSMIYGPGQDQLRLKYIDSGSDLVIALQCAAAVAAAIGTLLLQWWNGTKFSTYDNLEKKIGAVSKTLDVLKDVQTSVQQGTINEETGRNLTRRVLVEVDRLVGLGATVPLTDAASVDQRQLLVGKRDLKLLQAGDPEEDEETSPPPASPPTQAS